MKVSSIFGVFLFLYTLYLAYTGQLSSRNKYGVTRTLDRSQNPVMFWITIVAMLAVALVLIFGLYSF
jgi:fumarate reductase subunit C